MEELKRQLAALEIEIGHSIRAPTVKKRFYAVDKEEAFKRLIGKAYNDFTKYVGPVAKVERGSNFIDVYSQNKDEAGRPVLARYYLEQGKMNIIRGKFSFKYSTFSS